MSHDILINTANTLSVNASPGEDKRFPNTSIDAIFSFGDFKIHRDLTPNILSAETGGISFSNYSTLSSLSAGTDIFDAHKVINIHENELNLKKDDPNSYVYYGSFYTKVAAAINNIIQNWPYAILAYHYGTGSTILNYTNNYDQSSSFSIPISAITNQGELIYASGYTSSVSAETVLNLFTDWEQFEIQLSGGSVQTATTYTILSYNHDTVNGEMDFRIQGNLFTGNTSATTVPIYIRPTQQRFFQYKRTISDLEYQILFEEKFLVPNPDDDTFSRQTFSWPKSIDGFNPDTYGVLYDSYIETLLRSCSAVDEVKTNWMVRTMIPENYLELDSDGQAYRKLVSVYAEEFDKIKKYVDNLAYSHSVTYDNEESVPDKFLYRLSRLLGWEPINEFNDVDIFQYLAQEDSLQYTRNDYNVDLWKKILISINWLYKKKGTRDALQFIFKLMGAPDCLINFNEFVYKINQSITGTTASTVSEKINDTGYIDFTNSDYIFQEGGEGRGNGDAFINQWRPEFDPLRQADNRKVQTGDTEFFGTANLVNTKEVEIELSPAAAIECDVKSWYGLNYTDILSADLEILPSAITAMTISQWMDYIYANSSSPTNRKVEGWTHHNFYYRNLKNIYLTYYAWSFTNQVSNQLNFRKLESFLTLIQRNFGAYIDRLLPATTIIDRDGTTYRNTIFNRQKFVYPPGINSGSEFQIAVPPSPDLEINTCVVSATINDFIHPNVNTYDIVASVADNYNYSINSVVVENTFSTGINDTINAVTVNSELQTTNVQTLSSPPIFVGIVSFFPSSMTPQAQPNAIPTPYRTRTASDVAIEFGEASS